MNVQSPRCGHRDSEQLVVRRFIAAEDRSQRPMNRATTVGAPLGVRKEQRPLFSTEMRKSYIVLMAVNFIILQRVTDKQSF